jgi:Flp pilus assembly pilin Flp
LFEPFTRRKDAMALLAQRIRGLIRSEDGPTAVEYAVMMALIVVVVSITNRVRWLFPDSLDPLDRASTSD